ncbi:MAG: protoporphyrinogen oxidase [Candidatus Acidiferrales bacterium]
MGPSPVTPKRIAIIGGGISGLAAAYTLAEARRAGRPVEEYLFEAGPRLGGALMTERVEGFIVEAGADSFLTEKREALDFCNKLGLTPQLVGSEDQQRKTWILHRGRLHALPEGFEFFIPAQALSVLSTPLLTLRDKLALPFELVQRPRNPGADESVANFVNRHFGRSLVDNIVEPLLAAVYGGDPYRLSARAVLPRLVEMEQNYGSLIRGMRAAASARKKLAPPEKSGGAPRPPIFTTLRDGVETLAAAVRLHLEPSRVFPSRRVIGLDRAGGASEIRLRLEGHPDFAADAVIAAAPAREAAGLVRELDPNLGDALREIPYSSSLIVALAYRAEQAPRLPPGFGFLVPRKEGRRLRACTFVGQKFHQRVPPGHALFRCFLGGTGDESALELSDAEVRALVRRELENILGVSGEPLFSRIYRWPRALPQYAVGFPDLQRAIAARLAGQPGLFLCGNAYEGVGVPDCIRSGRLAAENCLRFLEST